MSGPGRGQRGMTVIELMIAMVILSVVVAAAFSVSYSIMNSYRDHRRAIGVERSARGAMQVLVDALRNSSPGVPDGNIVDLVGCELTTAWRGIRVENGIDAPDAIDLVYSRGGLLTTLRQAFDQADNVMVVENASQFAAGDQILVTDFVTGHLMTIDSIAPPAGPDWNLTLRNGAPQAMCPAPPANFTYNERATVLRVQKARFFVSATAPVLMMDPDGTPGPVPLPEEAVAEGVEDLQIAIGVDLNGNGGIDPEVGAVGNDDEWVYNHPDDAVPPVGTALFRAIRLTVIARSTDEVSNVATSKRPGAEDRLPATVPDVSRRRTLSTIIELRNLEGSP